MIIHVSFHGVGASLLWGANGDILSHVEGRGLAHGLAVPLRLEHLVDLHVDSVHQLFEFFSLFLTIFIATAGIRFLDFFVLVFGSPFRLSLLQGPTSVLLICFLVLQMRDTIFHVLNLSTEVPASSFGPSKLISRLHQSLNIFGPLGLVNLDARASIGAEDTSRLVQDGVVSRSILVRVLCEVVSHVER